MLNKAVNVCFFNFVIEALYSIAFPVYLEQAEVHNAVVKEIRNMFRNMSTRNVIRSSLYVRVFNLQNYIFGNQHDAQ